MKTITKEKARTEAKTEKCWQVILHNCYCHFFEEVVHQLTKALGCSIDTAEEYTFAAERIGFVSVFHGTKSKCENVANILGETGLNVEVVQ